jgi:16S rRNA (guanine527-N7)-methyltransferase
MTLTSPADLSLAAAGVGISLSLDDSERLVAFAQLLRRWNQRINLTASHSLSDILERQVLDCLMIELLPWPGEALNVVDIGSGAGLPGLVVALCHPHFYVTSLERTGKKISFQQEAARLLGLSRVTLLREDATAHAAGGGNARYDVALARAFADLATTLPLAAELLKTGGLLRTFKGGKLPEELAKIPASIRALYADEVVQRPYQVSGSRVAGVLVQFQRR